MRTAFLRLSTLPVLLAAILFGGSMATSPSRVQAAGAADSYAREMTRLINVARAANGKHALNVDLFLASKARDGSIPCPDDPAKTIAGRAKDFAAYNQMAHKLRNCDATGYVTSDRSFVNTLQDSWGYGSVGEILLVNGGYGGSQFLYTIKGLNTWTYATTGHGMLGWATSSSHWNIIMGSYDRLGCGAWSPGGTTFFYACLFAGGGPAPSGLAAAPNASPFNDPVPTTSATNPPASAPTATRRPAATKAPASAASSMPGATVAPIAAGSPSDVPTAAPTAAASATGVAPASDPFVAAPSSGAAPSASGGLVAAALPVGSDPLGPDPAAAALAQSAATNLDTNVNGVLGLAGVAAWLCLLGLLFLARSRHRARRPSVAS